MITSSQEWDNDEDGNAPSFAIDRWKEFVNNRCAGEKKSVFLQTRPGKLRPAPDVGTPAAVGPRAERRPHTSGGGLGTPGREGWVCCTPGLIRFSAGTTPRPQSRWRCSTLCKPQRRTRRLSHVDRRRRRLILKFLFGFSLPSFLSPRRWHFTPPPNLSGNVPP